MRRNKMKKLEIETYFKTIIIAVTLFMLSCSTDRAKEWDFFDQRAKDALAPVFYVGGNHDLTNVTMRDVWVKRYGSRYYHFVYRNVLFLILDSEDYSEERMKEIYLARAEYLNRRDSMTPEQVQEMAYMNMPERRTGDIGLNQSEYFLDAIADHSDVDWTFVFMHKPVWLKNNEPEFAAIESALSDHPYTLFNGHFHTYSHTIRNSRDYIMPVSYTHLTLPTKRIV